MFNNRGGNSSGGVNPHLYAQHQQQRQNQIHNNSNNNNNNNNRSGNMNTGQNMQNRPRPAQQNVNSQHNQQQHSNHHNQQRNPQQQQHQQGVNQQRPSQNQQRPQNQQNNNQQRPNQNQQNNNQQRPNQNQQNNNQQRPNQNQQQQQQPQAPPPPPVLPKGWKKEEIVKTKGILSGLVDIVYGPGSNCDQSTDLNGRKFKSKVELQRFFGEKYDMALLDWKTGKISQAVWRKQRRMKSIAANPNNFASACKYDTYLNIPIRHTSSLAKQPVYCVTNNHRNDPAPAHISNQNNNTNPNNQNNQNKMEKPKPIQLFWELRFNNTKSVDSDLVNTDEFKKEINLDNIPKFKNFDVSDETELRSVATACYLNPNKIMLGQDKEFNKNARVFIDREQPLITAYTVKEEEIKQQEAKLKEMRKQLEKALNEYENFDIDYAEKIELNNANQISGGSDIEATA